MSEFTRLLGLKPISTILAGSLSALVFASQSFAQIEEPTDLVIPLEAPAFNGAGVDLVSGAVEVQSPSITIGTPGSGGLVYSQVFRGDSWTHSTIGGITTDGSGGDLYVFMGGSGEVFEFSSGTYTPANRTGSSLTYNSSTGIYTYTIANGAEVKFDEGLIGFNSTNYGVDTALITAITAPSGDKTEFEWHSASYSGGTVGPFYRLDSIRNNRGYQIHIQYERNTLTSALDLSEFYNATKATALNNTIDVCNVGAACTGLSQSWPTLTIGGPASGAGSRT